MYNIFTGESFQDYTQIQNFEADFPWKVSLKILNEADYDSLSAKYHLYFKNRIFNNMLEDILERNLILVKYVENALTRRIV